jgi:hypothetical protein
MTVNTTERYSILRHKFENLPASPTSIDITFYGVLEMKQYSGGVADGQFQTNGTPAADTRLTAKVEIMSHANVYYLNRSLAPINGCVGFTLDPIPFSIVEGDILTITLDNQDLVQYSGDVSGNPVTCPFDSVAYLSQWVGFTYIHDNLIWHRGKGVRAAKFRGFVENIYNVQKAEK